MECHCLGGQPGYKYGLQFQVHQPESNLTTQFVTVDVVDILEWGRMDGPMYVGWNKA